MSDSSQPPNFASALRLYWDILCFRRGPDDLPVSGSLLAGTVLAYVALGVVASQAMPEVGSHGTALAFIETAALLLWGRVVLNLARRPERYLQTMCAVFGCQLVLEPFALPIAWFNGTYAETPGFGFVAMLLTIGLSMWALVVLVRILRSATGWPVMGCVAAAFLEQMVTLLVLVMLYPDLLAQQS